MSDLRKPSILCNKASVVAYIDLETFEKLEQKRGKTGRSAFIGALIEEAVKPKEICEA